MQQRGSPKGAHQSVLAAAENRLGLGSARREIYSRLGFSLSRNHHLQEGYIRSRQKFAKQIEEESGRMLASCEICRLSARRHSSRRRLAYFRSLLQSCIVVAQLKVADLLQQSQMSSRMNTTFANGLANGRKQQPKQPASSRVLLTCCTSGAQSQLAHKVS